MIPHACPRGGPSCHHRERTPPPKKTLCPCSPSLFSSPPKKTFFPGMCVGFLRHPVVLWREKTKGPGSCYSESTHPLHLVLAARPPHSQLPWCKPRPKTPPLEIASEILSPRSACSSHLSCQLGLLLQNCTLGSLNSRHFFLMVWRLDV